MSDDPKSRLAPPPASLREPVGTPLPSIGTGIHPLGHESQVIGKLSENPPQADPLMLFVPDPGDDQETDEDLAPAKGVLVSLVIGGVLWLVIIYVLLRV